MRNPHAKTGAATVLAMIFLAMFAAMGIAYAVATNNSMRAAESLSSVQAAQLQAESGLEYFAYQLARARVPSGASGPTLLSEVTADLAGPLDTEICPGGGDAGFTGLLAADGGTITLTVTGRGGGVQRTVSMDFQRVPVGAAVFDYAVASQGNVRMTGNASLLGANSPQEADVYSATTATNEAYNISGSCVVEGDIYASNPDAYATLGGNVSIGGETLWSGGITDHIHMDVGTLEFPEADPSVFKLYAINPVDASTDTTGNKSFENIRILKGVNPTFSGNIELKGVIFIEKPNQVTFTGNLAITGVIVTEDAGDDVYDVNTIRFTGNTTVLGVEQLDDLPQFAALKQMPGTFLLAPGFGVEFAGNFGTVSGSMAADEFQFGGNAGGTIHGTLVCYSDAELLLSGNAGLTFDQSAAPEMPPGFTSLDTLEPLPGTYTEH